MQLKEYLSQKKELVDSWLDSLLPAETIEPAEIHRAMRYSVFAGGKRIRPVLSVLTAEIFSKQPESVRIPACSLEMIHTYSLIHDDLPSMDDDDLRRGKPTCHKIFGEATAILAGDALLTEAFHILKDIVPGLLPAVLSEISLASSSRGMVGGQVVDMAFSGKKPDVDSLRRMHLMKTGALLTAPLVVGGICAGADQVIIEKLRLIGTKIGLLFQITDDLLDVCGTEEEIGKPVGSDQEGDKATYVSILGIEKARQMAGTVRDETLALVESLPCTKMEKRQILSDLVKCLYDRRN